MPDYHPVTREAYTDKFWQRYTNYRFAAEDAVAPLVQQELARAALTLPIALMKQGDEFCPVAVQGLEPGKNLLVDNQGRWLARYIPACYRGYPFKLIPSQDQQLLLCVDEASNLVNDSDGEAFMDANGEPSAPVQDVMNFLRQTYENGLLTAQIMTRLKELELIVPWPLKLQTPDGVKAVEGLFRFDEARLNSMPIDELEEVRKVGALPMIYCQLLSMQHVPSLGHILNRQTSAAAEVEDVEALFAEKDDTLKFSF